MPNWATFLSRAGRVQLDALMFGDTHLRSIRCPPSLVSWQGVTVLVTLSIHSDPYSDQPDDSRLCLSKHPHFGPALSLPGHRVRPIGASSHMLHSGDLLVIIRQLYHINAQRAFPAPFPDRPRSELRELLHLPIGT